MPPHEMSDLKRSAEEIYMKPEATGSHKYMKAIFALLLFVGMMHLHAADEPDHSKRKLPSLSIKAAIDKAEAFVKEEKISKEGKFLARAEYHESGPWTEPNLAQKTSGPYWQITYEPDILADGGQIFVLIYMDGKTRYVGGR